MVDSVLFPDPALRRGRPLDPDVLLDLHYGQVIAELTAERAIYELDPALRLPLFDPAAIAYRQAVWRDLQDPGVMAEIKLFAAAMASMRACLADAAKRYEARQRDRWFLAAVSTYAAGTQRLASALDQAALDSTGLQRIRGLMASLVASPGFQDQRREAERLTDLFREVRYDLHIEGLSVEIRPTAGEPDYGQEIDRDFERFRHTAASRPRFRIPQSHDLSQVEIWVLDGVEALNKELFEDLRQFRAAREDFVSPDVARFDREIQFYVAYSDYIAPLQDLGLKFSLPEVVLDRSDLFVREGFDLALAASLAKQGRAPVTNDVELRRGERILVVSGPNQGGKSTFGRMVGQIHLLAALGLPVPGAAARVCAVDRIFTHFERQERVGDLRSKLENDLVRIHGILEAASAQSLVIINEIFSSTTLQDAIFLSARIAEAIVARDLICVWITFIDEVAACSSTAVSLMSTVDPANPSERTFKVLRRQADGLAYAMSLAEKHRLTASQIKARLS